VSTDDERLHAKEHAEQMETSLELLQKDERHTIVLMERLDTLATSLRAHAEKWERVNPAVAARVLEQEQDVHRLHSELARMAEMEVEAQSKLMADIDRMLGRALGEE
jgi:hypothetical protein